jgi:hypothetical protein
MHTIESEKSKYYKAWTLAYDADSSCGVNHVDEFLRALKTQPNQTVADVGCGNGIATAKLQAKVLMQPELILLMLLGNNNCRLSMRVCGTCQMSSLIMFFVQTCLNIFQKTKLI